MTEYDYSPEAYERYTRTQQRIAEWVDRTEEQRPHFGSADAPRTWGVASPLLQSATKGIQSMFRRNRRPSSSNSDSSSDTYANSHRSPGPMQPLRPMNAQQQSVAQQQQQHQSSHKHSSHRSSRGHKPHRSAYVVTTPPATVPSYAYIYTNPQGTPGVMIVPPKGSVAASPPPTYYQPQSAPVSGYTYPQSAPAAGSFTYAPPTQTQTQNRSQIQQIYAQPSVPQVQPQTQYAQSAYPPVIYPITPYTVYPQQTQAAVQPQPQIIYEMSSRKKHRRSESSRRSR